VCVVLTCAAVAEQRCAALVYSMQTVAIQFAVAGCAPGQHSALAFAFPQDQLVEGTLPALRHVAGDGAHDEAVFTVVPDAADGNWADPLGSAGEVSGWTYATRYTTGNLERDQDVTSWQRQRQLLEKLFHGRDLRILEFGCGTLELAVRRCRRRCKMLATRTST
jgi:hypothetical protein